MSGRLPEGGLLIDRTRPVEFTFNGKRLAGFAGDTLASALLANDQILVGRSFKYHRPRGIVASGVEEPNALMGLGRGGAFEPNARATTTDADAAPRRPQPEPLAEPLVRRRRARRPPRRRSCRPASTTRPSSTPAPPGSISSSPSSAAPPASAPPPGARPRHLRLHLRHGRHPRHRRRRRRPRRRPRGRRGGRARAPDRAGAALGRPGARRWRHDRRAGGAGLDRRHAGRARRHAERHAAAPRTLGAGVYDHGYVLAEERLSGDGPRRRLWRIRARRIVTATGALERPLPFAGNDVPGVMLAGGGAGLPRPLGRDAGRRTVVVTNNDDAYRTAIALNRAGVRVPAILDARAGVTGPLPEEARALGIRIAEGRAIAGVTGGRRVTGVEVCAQAGDGADGEGIACDTVAMSGGWSPVGPPLVALRRQARLERGAGALRARPGPAPARPRRRRLRPDRRRGLRRPRPRRRPRATPTTPVAARRRTWASRPATSPRPKPPRSAERPDRAGLDHAARRRAGAAGQGVPRLPERREGLRRAPRRPGRLRQRRARQALHHPRHGDRPGKALQHQRPGGAGRRPRPPHPAGGHHHLPPPLRPRHHRRARRRGARRRSSSRPAGRPWTPGMRPTARRGSRWATGGGPTATRAPARAWRRRSPARSSASAAASACSTPPPSARSW